MKRETLLTIAVVVLLLLNLGTIGYLVFQRPPMGGNNPDRLIIEGLRLTPAQVEQFETLKETHKSQMRNRDEQQRERQHELWSLLRSSQPDTAQAQALVNRWLKLEQEKKMLTFEHFRSIRSLCNPEQQRLYDDLIGEIAQALMPGPRGPKK